MTDPLKLAEEIESLDGAEFYEADSDDGPVSVCNLAFDVPTIRLLAAALRLAEATDAVEMLSPDYETVESAPEEYRPWLTALAAYRAAKEGR